MNTECKLKSNLTWPKCPKSMQSNKNGTGPIITAKNAVLIVLELENCYLVRRGDD